MTERVPARPALHVSRSLSVGIVLVLVVVLVLGALGFRDRKETDFLQLMGGGRG